MQMSLKRKIAVAASALALVGGMSLAVPTAASAADPCGYFKQDGYDKYNHCGSDNAYIQIDQVVGNYSQCVGPGTTILRNPGNYGIYSITNAFYLRSC